MAKLSTEPVPPHLAPLFANGVTGALNLLAAWDGLSDETKILVLHKLNTEEIDWPTYCEDRLRRRAFDSSSAYLRYLAAKKYDLRELPDTDDLRSRIESDPSDLVKCAPLEDPWQLFKREDGPQAFLARPQAARVAMMRTLGGRGEEVASVLKYACESLLPAGGITEQELHELVNAYLTSEKTENYYSRDCGYDGYANHMQRKDLGALWEIVPMLPDLIAYELIGRLPAFAGPAETRRSADAAKAVAESLDDGQLRWLLYRNDVKLPELRKKLFLESSREEVKGAAATHHFDLTPEEFAAILEKPIAECVKAVRRLASGAYELNLALLEAIHDFLFAVSDEEDFSSAFEDAYVAKLGSERQLKALTGYEREKQIRDLDLYHLARSVVPWKPSDAPSSLYGELAFLSDCICAGNTWLTYCKMRAKWRERFRDGDPKRLLPGERGDADDLDGEWDISAIFERGSPRDLSQFVAWATSQLSGRTDDSKSQLFADVGRLAEKLFERSLASERRVDELKSELEKAIEQASTLRAVAIATLVAVVLLLFL